MTGEPQPGNPRPRLFRLPEDRAVVNRMGFNNDGAEAVAARLARRGASRRVGARSSGINIGKTKVVPAEHAIADYEKSTGLLAPHADYLVVNVSSPNTPGLRDLQAVEVLEPLLTAVRRRADQVRPDDRVPLLVKIAPDLGDEDVLAVADLAVAIGLDGLIATNTTITREGLRTDAATVEAIGAGGLSGAPLRERATAVLRMVRERVGPDLTLVGVGGISTAADARERLDAGADLVQGYTAFVYEGALWPRTVVAGLVVDMTSAAHRRPGGARPGPRRRRGAGDQAGRGLPPPDDRGPRRARALPGRQLRGRQRRRRPARPPSAVDPPRQGDRRLRPDAGRGGRAPRARQHLAGRAPGGCAAPGHRPAGPAVRAAPRAGVLRAGRRGVRRRAALPARRPAARAGLPGHAGPRRRRRGPPALRARGPAQCPLGQRGHPRRVRGRAGRRASQVDAVLERADADVVYAAGPTATLAAVAAAAERRGAWSQVALETPMACGTGLCQGCPVPVVAEDGVTRRVRACVDGPVIRGDRVHWGELG